jgi:hypothetical protein
MPEYPWLFDGSPDKPNARGLAMLTYIQWLGSWQESYPHYEAWTPSALVRPETAEEVPAEPVAADASTPESTEDAATDSSAMEETAK